MKTCPDIVIEFLIDYGIPEHWMETGLERLRAFGELLAETNQQINLIRLADDDDFWIKHVADSLALVSLFPNLLDSNLRVCDVGTGAGLPAIPLACLNPELEITALDGTGKKIRFVESAVAQLKLSNIKPVWGRAEEIAPKQPFHEAFDLVTLRAVGAAPKILPKCRELIDSELGMIVFYKTPAAIDKELRETRQVAEQLNAVVDVSPPFELPMDAGTRQFLLVTPLD